MIHFEKSHTIQATQSQVWAVLERYMQIDEFAPMITSVDALTSGDNGVGSVRRNHFENGGYMTEEVTEWQEGSGYTIKAIDMPSMPLKKATSKLFITPVGGQSKVTWTFDYQVKLGPLGWLMGQTLMKMMMGKIIEGNLLGLEKKVMAKQ